MADELKTVQLNAAEISFASDGMDAPTFFVDDIRGASLINGVARLNIVENRLDPQTEQLKSKIVVVLAVPIDMVRNWGPFLTKHFPQNATPADDAADNA